MISLLRVRHLALGDVPGAWDVQPAGGRGVLQVPVGSSSQTVLLMSSIPYIPLSGFHPLPTVDTWFPPTSPELFLSLG